METENRWVAAAEKLLKLTQTRKLEWEPREDWARPHVCLVGPIFSTEALNRVIATYEFVYPYYDPDTDDTTPAKEVAIEFVSPNGDVEYRWPKTRFHWALLDAIRFNTSSVKEFLDEFLAE